VKDVWVVKFCAVALTGKIIMLTIPVAINWRGINIINIISSRGMNDCDN
jgi:hypothetical protein